jgi:hypothetical protein
MLSQRLEWQLESNFGNCQIIGIGGGLALGAGASLIGGGLQAGASKGAANVQAQAAQQAAQLQYSMYQQTAQRLQPWTNMGTAAVSQLGGLLGLSGYQASGAGGLSTGALVTPFQPTMQQLSQTPGYQFTMQQGLEAVQNQSAAAGQGGGLLPGGGGISVSGPEGRGLVNYAENLASTTYQQQFNNYWSQLSNIYNMMQGGSAMGANAAAMTGQAGLATAQGVSNALQTGAAATAAGITGSANALGGTASNIAQLGILSQMANTGSPIQNLTTVDATGTGGLGNIQF